MNLKNRQMSKAGGSKWEGETCLSDICDEAALGFLAPERMRGRGCTASALGVNLHPHGRVAGVQRCPLLGEHRTHSESHPGHTAISQSDSFPLTKMRMIVLY